jgi:hypothetical protein
MRKIEYSTLEHNPVIVFTKDPNNLKEIIEWCKISGCGKCIGPRVWHFSSEAERDWFILKWID